MLLDNLSERLLALVRTPCSYSSRTGRDAIERGGDSQDERDVAPTTPVSFAPACFDSIAEEAFAFAGTVTGSR